MKMHQRNDQGQIIILLAVSIVVVMMVAALAVDGGMIYTERRFAQNAADAAGFAGGGAVLNSGELDVMLVCPASSSYNTGNGNFSDANNVVAMAVSAAQSRGTANNVSSLPYLGYKVNNVVKEDLGLDENQGVIIECKDDGDTKTIDVIVRVTSQVSTSFAHLIYPGPLQTTNAAKVRVLQEGVTLSGDAIISLSNNCNNNGNQNTNIGGVIFNNADLVLNINGGGVFSNSCLNLHKNIDPEEITVDGGFNIVKDIIGDEPIELVNQTNTGLPSLPKGFPNPPNPKHDCKQLENDGPKNDSSDTISEGYYPGGIKVNGGKTLTLNDGLYCVGSEFDVQNGTIQGKNVTIYLYDTTTVNINGGLVKLVAPTTLSNPYYGLLFYMEGDVSTDWNGSNDSHLSGLVYAPQRNIVYSGNSDNTNGTCPDIEGLDCTSIDYPTLFVGNQFVFKGSSTVNIDNTGKDYSTLINNLYLNE